MDGWNFKLNLTLFSFIFLLFSFSSSTVRATSSHVTVNQLNPLEDIVCSIINCGQGKCEASNSSMLGFECQCNPGWRKIQIGPLTFPSCLVPNCTVDFHCGGESPPAPPPPASLPPPANQNCELIWCGDGKCVSNGTGHVCHCNQGSENLFNSSRLACFKPCYFGADCQGLDLPLGRPQPPPPPPPSSSSSDANGYRIKGLFNSSVTIGGLNAMIVAVAACLQWF